MKRREPLRRAAAVQRAAAQAGFDWPRGDPRVWRKLAEELGELKRARHRPRQAAEELGDLLFMVVNLSRHLGVDAAAALAAAVRKFERRYGYVRRHAGGSRDLEVLDRLWREAKRRERKRS